jgi:hypothetical protein
MASNDVALLPAQVNKTDIIVITIMRQIAGLCWLDS